MLSHLDHRRGALVRRGATAPGAATGGSGCRARDDPEQDFAQRILPFDLPAARAYALLVTERERRGKPISGFDAQIASICWVHTARLATRNVRDFDGPDIEL